MADEIKTPPSNIIKADTDLRPCKVINVISRSSPGYTKLAQQRGIRYKGLTYKLGEMPVDIYQAGIELATLNGHPNPRKYWSEEIHGQPYYRFKQWLEKNKQWKN